MSNWYLLKIKLELVATFVTVESWISICYYYLSKTIIVWILQYSWWTCKYYILVHKLVLKAFLLSISFIEERESSLFLLAPDQKVPSFWNK